MASHASTSSQARSASGPCQLGRVCGRGAHGCVRTGIRRLGQLGVERAEPELGRGAPLAAGVRLRRIRLAAAPDVGQDRAREGRRVRVVGDEQIGVARGLLGRHRAELRRPPPEERQQRRNRSRVDPSLRAVAQLAQHDLPRSATRGRRGSRRRAASGIRAAGAGRAARPAARARTRAGGRRSARRSAAAASSGCRRCAASRSAVAGSTPSRPEKNGTRGQGSRAAGAAACGADPGSRGRAARRRAAAARGRAARAGRGSPRGPAPPRCRGAG